MRPNKQINPGAHRSRPAQSGKGRYFTAGEQNADGDEHDTSGDETAAAAGPLDGAPVINKYAARASVAPDVDAEQANEAEDLEHAEWTDPLDEVAVDLTTVTIDLRETLRQDVPDTYYQRLISKIPGRS